MFVSITEEDLPSIARLMNRAYRGTGHAASWNSEAAYISGDRTTEELLREDLRAHPAAAFLKWVAAPDDQILGCVWLKPEDDGIWYLGSLAADPLRQQAGLGSAILCGAEDWVRDHGGDGIRMTVVHVRKRLIEWYERRGYVLTDETEPFPYGDDRFGTPLRDDLHFVVLAKAL